MRNGFIWRNRALDDEDVTRYSSRRAGINGNTAKVDFREGVLRDVSVMFVDAKVREYVSVHDGYVIEVIDRKAPEEDD